MDAPSVPYISTLVALDNRATTRYHSGDRKMTETDVTSEVQNVDDDYEGYMNYGDGGLLSILMQGFVETILMPPLDKDEEL
jgi:hypothetical protein